MPLGYDPYDLEYAGDAPVKGAAGNSLAVLRDALIGNVNRGVKRKPSGRLGAKASAVAKIAKASLAAPVPPAPAIGGWPAMPPPLSPSPTPPAPALGGAPAMPPPMAADRPYPPLMPDEAGPDPNELQAGEQYAPHATDVLTAAETEKRRVDPRIEELKAIQQWMERARSPQAAANKRMAIMDIADGTDPVTVAGRAAIEQKMAPSRRSIPELMAAKRASEYQMLNNPGIRGGGVMPGPDQYVDTQADTDRKAQLAAAMKARSAALMAKRGKTAGQIENARMLSPEYQMQEQRRRVLQLLGKIGSSDPDANDAMREKLMQGGMTDVALMEKAQKRNQNVRTAYAKGRLSQNAQNTFAQEGIIPDLQERRMRYALAMQQAQNPTQPAKRYESDVLSEFDPGLYRKMIEATIAQRQAEAALAAQGMTPTP